jgi:non-heme chloroperoxidase
MSMSARGGYAQRKSRHNTAMRGALVAAALGALWPTAGTCAEPYAPPDHPMIYRDIASGPFYGFNRSGAKVSQGVIDNWFRQSMMGAANAAYECIKAFSETDFTEDLQSIKVPVLILHGDDDQIVPVADSAPLAAKLVKNATLKVYPGLPHGVCTTHPEIINPDLLAFIKA